jgi:ribonucleoside-diphosphate reductase alpha chain
VRDFAYGRWQATAGKNESVPDEFVTAESLPATAHLAMQAVLQPYVDNAISKTVNLPPDASVDEVEFVGTEGLHRISARCPVGSGVTQSR